MKRVRWSLVVGVCLALAGCASGQTTSTTGLTQKTPPTPTATPMPTSGIWRTASTLSTFENDLEFSPSSPQRGYYCTHADSLPTSSTPWLFRSDDGGMNWQMLGGMTLPHVTDPGSFACYLFVDAHDPNDVFVEIVIATNCPGQGPCGGQVATLWRTQDGGASWSQLRLPPSSTWKDGELASLIVSGSRLIGVEGDYSQSEPDCATDANAGAMLQHINDLVASDDGGQTWQTIGQSIYDQGLSIPGKGEWVTGGQRLQNNGAAIVVHAACEKSGSSSGGIQYDSEWISHDNGATWSQLPVNGGSDVEAFSFTSAPSGGTYGAAVDLGTGGGSGALPIVRYSDDSGASWYALPSLSVVPHAQTKDAQVKVLSMTLMPDGAVLAAIEVDWPAILATSMPGTPTAATRQVWYGAYAIDPHSAHPAWQPFTMTPSKIVMMNGAPLSKTANGWALWGSSYDQQGQIASNYYLTPLP